MVYLGSNDKPVEIIDKWNMVNPIKIEFEKTAEYLMTIPQSTLQLISVSALVVSWFVVFKPLLAKKKLLIWQQVIGGLAFGIGFGVSFAAAALSLGPNA